MTARPGPDTAVEDRLRELARERFGYDDLRPGQLTAAAALVRGRDALVVMPTGHGKSAVYQLAALALDGPTVVVSPLISLQEDQVAALSSRGTHDAVAVNSAQGRERTAEAWRRLEDGEAEFVFLSPEQLARDDVLDRLAALHPSLLVVDEAHCVSAWGHDFRPDYLRLGDVVDRLGHPVVAALTATASPPVRAEVVERLRMRDPLQVVQGFDRPNLHLEVHRCADADEKRREVVLRAATSAKPGIVYVATRKDAEAYADELSHLGLDVEAYHAGMRAAERTWVHEAFALGDLDVVVATSAFGMGIDKADVRFVLHASVPDSLDSYYQEVGRAGRDGEPALTALFYRPEDLGLQRFLAGGGPDEQVLAAVAAVVRDETAGQSGNVVPVSALRASLTLSATRVTTALNLLVQAGAVLDGDGGVSWAPGAAGAGGAARAAEGAEAAEGPGASVAEAVAAAVAVAETHRRVGRSRLEMLRGYAETTTCRRAFLLGYFGEHYPHRCGSCDVCRTSPVDATDPATARTADPSGEDHQDPRLAAWPVHSRVQHRAWGPGVVMRPEGDRITVLFEQQGYKTLSLDAVEQHGLLERVAG